MRKKNPFFFQDSININDNFTNHISRTGLFRTLRVGVDPGIDFELMLISTIPLTNFIMKTSIIAIKT